MLDLINRNIKKMNKEAPEVMEVMVRDRKIMLLGHLMYLLPQS
jgi:hypothetical protein